MKNLKLLLLPSLFLIACARPSSQPENKNNQNVNEQSFTSRTQLVKCQGYSISSFKTKDGVSKTFAEKNFRTQRTTMTSDDGLTIKILTTGEGKTSNDYLRSSTSSHSIVRFYDYTANRLTKIEKLEGGLVREASQVKIERTAKDGYELLDSNGNVVKKEITEHNYEDVYKIEGNKKILVSSKSDGTDNPVMDFVTYTSKEPDRTIEYTTLIKPYSLSENGEVILTVEKDDMYCIFEN